MDVLDVRVPDTQICLASTEFVRQVSPAFLFNHVMRSFAFGRMAGELRRLDLDEELFFLGAVMHDLGLADRFVKNERFEIDGADAAAEFLAEQGFPENRITVIWDAIALHTTAGVPQRKRPEIALVQLGAAIDVGVVPHSMLSEPFVAQILEQHPRLGFKKAMLETLTEIARRKPQAAIGTFVADVGERCVHGFKAPNFCDVLEGAHFDE